MQNQSPIRSVSPFVKAKIVFNYPPSPIRERPSLTQIQHPQINTIPQKIALTEIGPQQ
jgi:hypothetical protein